MPAVLDRDLALCHGGQPDEGPYLDHIGQHPVFGSPELVHPFDDEQIAADAADAGAHAVEHPAQLLDIRLAGGIINSSNSLGHHRGHDNIGRSRNRRLVEQHVGAFQTGRFQVEEAFVGVVSKFGAQLFKTDDMGVQPAPADLLSAGFGNKGLAKTGQHGSGHHDRASQPAALLAKGFRAQVIDVDGGGLEDGGVAAGPFDLDAHLAQ